MKKRWRDIGACGLLASAMVAGSGAFAATITPHRAVYQLALDSAEQGSTVSAVNGAIYIEWQDACEGYVTEQRIVTRLLGPEGAVSVNDLRSNTFESRDLATFRFNMVNYTGERITENFQATAIRGEAGEPGSVVYREPTAGEFDLPAKAIFPTEHALGLIATAEAGERWHEQVVFEGGDPSEIFKVIAFIGEGRIDEDAPEGLEGKTSWPATLSYYALDDRQGVPVYEVRFRMYANGLSDDLVLDYGDFAVRGSLQSLELLPEPEC